MSDKVTAALQHCQDTKRLADIAARTNTEAGQALYRALSQHTGIPLEFLKVDFYGDCTDSITGHCYYDYRTCDHDEICEVCGGPSDQQ